MTPATPSPGPLHAAGCLFLLDAVVYCTEVELKERGAKAYGICMKEATIKLNNCVQGVILPTVVTGAESTQ